MRLRNYFQKTCGNVAELTDSLWIETLREIDRAETSWNTFNNSMDEVVKKFRPLYSRAEKSIVKYSDEFRSLTSTHTVDHLKILRYWWPAY